MKNVCVCVCVLAVETYVPLHLYESIFDLQQLSSGLVTLLLPLPDARRVVPSSRGWAVHHALLLLPLTKSLVVLLHLTEMERGSGVRRTPLVLSPAKLVDLLQKWTVFVFSLGVFGCESWGTRTVLSSWRSCWLRLDDSCSLASRAAIFSSLISTEDFSVDSSFDSSNLNLKYTA